MTLDEIRALLESMNAPYMPRFCLITLTLMYHPAARKVNASISTLALPDDLSLAQRIMYKRLHRAVREYNGTR